MLCKVILACDDERDVRYRLIRMLTKPKSDRPDGSLHYWEVEVSKTLPRISKIGEHYVLLSPLILPSPEDQHA